MNNISGFRTSEWNVVMYTEVKKWTNGNFQSFNAKKIITKQKQGKLINEYYNLNLTPILKQTNYYCYVYRGDGMNER